MSEADRKQTPWQTYSVAVLMLVVLYVLSIGPAGLFHDAHL